MLTDEKKQFIFKKYRKVIQEQIPQLRQLVSDYNSYKWKTFNKYKYFPHYSIGQKGNIKLLVTPFKQWSIKDFRTAWEMIKYYEHR